MKLNNKGFAISSILYGLLIVMMLVMVTILSIMTFTRSRNIETATELKNELEKK